MSKVLVVSRADINAIVTDIPAQYDPLTDGVSVFQKVPAEFFSLKTQMVERSIAEVDASVLQIIPYIVVRDGETIFGYSRGKKGGEGRLHAKYSIGLGGHIDTEPTPFTPLAEIITLEALRELNEEISLDATDAQELKLLSDVVTNSYLIYNDADEVGSVHLGLVIQVNVTKDQIAGNETDVIERGRFWATNDLYDAAEQGDVHFENWSRVTFKHLFVHTDIIVDQSPVIDQAPAVTLSPVVDQTPVVDTSTMLHDEVVSAPIAPVTQEPPAVVPPAIVAPSIQELEDIFLAKMNIIPLEPTVTVTDNAAEVVDIVSPVAQATESQPVEVTTHPDVTVNELVVDVPVVADVPVELNIEPVVIEQTNLVPTQSEDSQKLAMFDPTVNQDSVDWKVNDETISAPIMTSSSELISEPPPVEETPVAVEAPVAPVDVVETLVVETSPVVTEPEVVEPVFTTSVVEDMVATDEVNASAMNDVVQESGVITNVTDTVSTEVPATEAPVVEPAAVVEAPVVEVANDSAQTSPTEVTAEVAASGIEVTEPPVVAVVGDTYREIASGPSFMFDGEKWVETPIVDVSVDTSVQVSPDVNAGEVNSANVAVDTTATPVINTSEITPVDAEAPVESFEMPVMPAPVVEAPVVEAPAAQFDFGLEPIDTTTAPVSDQTVATDTVTVPVETPAEVVAVEPTVQTDAPVSASNEVVAPTVDAPVETVTEVAPVVDVPVTAPDDSIPLTLADVIKAETPVVDSSVTVGEAPVETPVEVAPVAETVASVEVAPVDTVIVADTLVDTPVVASEDSSTVSDPVAPVVVDAPVVQPSVDETQPADVSVDSTVSPAVETPTTSPEVVQSPVDVLVESAPVVDVQAAPDVVADSTTNVTEPAAVVDAAPVVDVISTDTPTVDTSVVDVPVEAAPVEVVVPATDAPQVPVETSTATAPNTVITDTLVDTPAPVVDSVSMGGTVQEISNTTPPVVEVPAGGNTSYDIAANSDVAPV